MIGNLGRRPFVAGLLVVAAVLAVLLALEIADASRSRIPAGASRPAAPAQSKLLPPLAPVAPEQAYQETVNRPLFIATRRPAPPQAAAAAAPAFNRGQFVLLGVTIAGNTRIAMLREKSNGHIHRVEQGRDVNGLRVAQIEREAVTLAQGDEKEVVQMQVQKVGPSAAVHAPGPFGQAPGAPAQAAPPAQPAQAAPAGPPGPGSIPPASARLLGIMPPVPTLPGQATPQGASPNANNTPMSPEELLARRRARRTQQNQ